MHISFFFSSRRRHTRCLSDWSSDVCSSDLTILYPILGKIQLPIQQYRAPFAGITKEHSYLAVLDPSRSSAVLPLDPRRMDALLQESSLVQNQYCIWIP